MKLTKDILKPHQLEILKADAKYIIGSGGVGTFKTSTFVLKLFTHCIAHPGQRIIVGAQTYPQLEDVFLSEWQEQIPDNYYEYNQQKHNIYIYDINAEIRLRYADNPKAGKRIRGSNISGFYMIQAETFSNPEFFDEVNQRVRLDVKHIRLVDCNPGAPNHFIYKRFIDHKSGVFIGNDVKEIGNYAFATTDSTVFRIPTTPETSTYPIEEIEEWRKTLPSAVFSRMVNGEWVASEGAVYDDYEVVKHADIDLQKDISSFWVGVDPGTATSEPNLAIIWIGEIKDSDKYILFDERLIKFSNMKALSDLIESVSDGYGGNDKLHFIIKDWHGGSGSLYSSELPRVSSYLTSVVPPAADSTKYKRVISGVMMLIEAFKSRRLVVHEKCEKVIKDTLSYTWNADTSEPDKKVYDSHLLDAVRYCWIRVGRR